LHSSTTQYEPAAGRQPSLSQRMHHTVSNATLLNSSIPTTGRSQRQPIILPYTHDQPIHGRSIHLQQ
jgi:hypothetical protein